MYLQADKFTYGNISSCSHRSQFQGYALPNHSSYVRAAAWWIGRSCCKWNVSGSFNKFAILLVMIIMSGWILLIKYCCDWLVILKTGNCVVGLLQLYYYAIGYWNAHTSSYLKNNLCGIHILADIINILRLCLVCMRSVQKVCDLRLGHWRTDGGLRGMRPRAELPWGRHFWWHTL